MTEIREGPVEYKEITEGVLKMEQPKYLTIDELLELLGQFNNHIPNIPIIHMGGYFMNVSRTDSIETESKFPFGKKHVIKTVLDNIYYSPGKYHRYLILPQENSHSTKDKGNAQRTVFKDAFSVETGVSAIVTKYEDWELTGIDRYILKAVEEQEKIRKANLNF